MSAHSGHPLEWNGWRRHVSRTHNKAYWFNKGTRESVFEEDFFGRFPDSAAELKQLIREHAGKTGSSAVDSEAAPETSGGRKRYGKWRDWLRFKSSKGYFFWSNPNTQETMVEEDFFKRHPDARQQGEGVPEAPVEEDDGELDLGSFFTGDDDFGEDDGVGAASHAEPMGQGGGPAYAPSAPAHAGSSSSGGYMPSAPATSSGSSYMPSAPAAGDGQYAPADSGSSYMPSAPANDDDDQYAPVDSGSSYMPSAPAAGSGQYAPADSGSSYMPSAPAAGTDQYAPADSGSSYMPSAPAAGTSQYAAADSGSSYMPSAPAAAAGADQYAPADSGSSYLPSALGGQYAPADSGSSYMPSALGGQYAPADSGSSYMPSAPPDGDDDQYAPVDSGSSYMPSSVPSTVPGAPSFASGDAPASSYLPVAAPGPMGSVPASSAAQPGGQGGEPAGAFLLPTATDAPAPGVGSVPGSASDFPPAAAPVPAPVPAYANQAGAAAADALTQDMPGAATREAAEVAAGYNSHVSLNEDRKRSPMLHLFGFNNWVKNLLIRRFAKHKLPVLDCACGRGGDMHKWRESGTLAYVGLDIARMSLEEASRRHRNQRAQYPRWGIHSQLLQLQHDITALKKKRTQVRTSERDAKKDLAKLENDLTQSEEMISRREKLEEAINEYERQVAQIKAQCKTLESQLARVDSEAAGTFGKPVARFICADASAQMLYEPGRPLARTRFGTVSVQFALHYMFQSRQRVHTFFNNVSKTLVNCGRVIGTTPDADVLVKRVRNTAPGPDGSVTFGNRFYSISFPQESVDKIMRAHSVEDTYGIAYTFQMEGAVPGLVEYLVPRRLLLQVAGQYSLRPVLALNFQHFLRYHTDKTDDFRRMLNSAVALGKPFDGVSVPTLAKLPKADVEMYRNWLYTFNVLNWAGTIYREHWEAANLYTAFVFEKHGEHAPLAEGSDPLADETEVFDMLHQE